MLRYLLIESKSSLDTELFRNLFTDLISFQKMDVKKNEIIIYYEQESELNFADIINNLVSETLVDIRLYASYQFNKEIELNNHLLFIKQKMSEIPFNKYTYLDDKIILLNNLKNITKEHRDIILKKYKDNQLMLETIKTYLDTNQNMSDAAKKLYVHRNTLIQRVDKFILETGFNIRNFKEAYLIYHLL